MKKVFLFAFLLCALLAHAQNINNYSYVVVLDNPHVTSSGDTVVVHNIEIAHSDSLQIVAVEVQMGNFPGGSNIASHIFTIGQNFGLPNSYTIGNTSTSIQIGMGYHNPGIYHYRVKLYAQNGSQSNYLMFNSISNQYTMQP